jgi:hypothetical protein
MQHGLQLINDTLGCLSRIGPRKLSDFQLIRSFNDSATHNLVRRHMDGFPAVSFQKGKYNAMGTSSPGSLWRSSSNSSSLHTYLRSIRRTILTGVWSSSFFTVSVSLISPLNCA